MNFTQYKKIFCFVLFSPTKVMNLISCPQSKTHSGKEFTITEITNIYKYIIYSLNNLQKDLEYITNNAFCSFSKKLLLPLMSWM